jgi:transposase
MIQPPPGTRVYLACHPVDMRRGFDGLSAEVADVLKQDPYSGHLFIFRGKRGGYLKILYWDTSGLACSPNDWRKASSHGRRGLMRPSG